MSLFIALLEFLNHLILLGLDAIHEAFLFFVGNFLMLLQFEVEMLMDGVRLAGPLFSSFELLGEGVLLSLDGRQTLHQRFEQFSLSVDGLCQCSVAVFQALDSVVVGVSLCLHTALTSSLHAIRGRTLIATSRQRLEQEHLGF